jgi:Transposase DDE domain
MLHREAILVMLVRLVDGIAMAQEPAKRGHPKEYTDRLMVKALVVMVIRRLYTAYSLLAFLNQDSDLTNELRDLLTENGRFPVRRTWERRLSTLPDTLPGLIGSLGRHLVSLIQPWGSSGKAAAVDSTPLRAKGGVWHKKDRDKGVIPHSTIDTEAYWSQSGYHGWWYGWKLHMACTAGAALWIPLAADLTPANVYDATMAPQLQRELPPEVTFVLGDTHYNDDILRDHCRLSNRWLVATRRGKYPHTDPGVEVRRIFHKLRSKAIEPFNALFKNIFEWGGQVPVKGLKRVRLIVLGAVFVYQLVLLYQFLHALPLGVNVKPLLRAA